MSIVSFRMPKDFDWDKFEKEWTKLMTTKIGSYLPTPTVQYECCKLCDEHDKLPEAIQKKILLLMKLGGANVL